eukprot:3032048-Prorocentrum_lima.AAC.1
MKQTAARSGSTNDRTMSDGQKGDTCVLPEQERQPRQLFTGRTWCNRRRYAHVAGNSSVESASRQ